MFFKIPIMKKIIFCIVLLSFSLSCRSEKETLIESGMWRAELQLTDTEILPFNFEVISRDSIQIFNAEEQILVKDIQITKDSITFKTPVFEGYVKASLTPTMMNGHFIKESLDRVVPFSAQYGIDFRFQNSKKVSENVEGIWEVVFSPDSDEDRYIAKGIFEQKGSEVTGTFRTTTGDYRFLEGVMDGNTMKLSTFDGAHAFLFTADVGDSLMNGQFYSGNHWQESFTGKRNENYELPDANDLTFLREGYDTLEFSFPDANGNMVSLDDERFEDKVVVVQIMGTWCPNCLDESKYY